MVGASPSIEPWAACAFNSQGRAGSFLIKNKHLEKVLAKYGMNTEEVWKRIILDKGSVQGLEFLTELEKAVFKTALEINPMTLVSLQADRQPEICQSASLNTFVKSDITMEEMSDIHIYAWIKKVKTMYYCRSEPATRADLGTGGDKPLNAVPVKIEYEECISCSA
jgi:ribonucleoside-diphosphate reductase alpha chain